jgi:D-alanyl-D-alanine dipeptidase
MSLSSVENGRKELPEGFVYLSDIDPSIQQCLRYAGIQNFLGEVVTGYETQATYNQGTVMTIECAMALRAVQQHLNQESYDLVVYDAYRPQKAVNHFVRWSEDFSSSNAQVHKHQYYPRVNKERAFELGYIARRSGHSRGSTVDVSVIPLGEKVSPDPIYIERAFSSDLSLPILDDGTIDMGTSFDLFDRASHPELDNPVLALCRESDRQVYQEHRDYLKLVMETYGFVGDDCEWWHYTLKDEKYKDTYFDFEF